MHFPESSAQGNQFFGTGIASRTGFAISQKASCCCTGPPLPLLSLESLEDIGNRPNYFGRHHFTPRNPVHNFGWPQDPIPQLFLNFIGIFLEIVANSARPTSNPSGRPKSHPTLLETLWNALASCIEEVWTFGIARIGLTDQFLRAPLFSTLEQWTLLWW